MVSIYKLLTQWRYRINPIKTVLFNFRKFNFLTAIRFPVLIGNNVIFRNLDGDIIVKKINNWGGGKQKDQNRVQGYGHPE